MFDMGITELALIGIVALIVIGPERLPGVARTAGKYLGRLKRFMSNVRHDVEQELRADELRQILAEQQKELNTLKDSIQDSGRKVEQDFTQAAEEIAAESPGAHYASKAATDAAADDTLAAYHGDPSTQADTPKTVTEGGPESTPEPTGAPPPTDKTVVQEATDATAEVRKAARDAGP